MNGPIHIGYVVRMFPRFSETFVLQEILELERQGASVTVFSLNKPNEGRFHPALSRLKARVLYLDDREAKRWWSWLPDEWPVIEPYAGALWRLVQEVAMKKDGAEIDNVFYGALLSARAKALGVEALHAHFATVSCSLAHYAHRISGIPYSFTAHAKDIFADTVDRAFLTRKINESRFAVTVTEYNRRFLVEQHPGVNADRIRVLYNGVDLDFFSQDGTVIRHDPPVILGIGRLVAKKGFADLVRATDILKQSGQRFRCVIIGQGREESTLRGMIEESNLTAEVELAGAKHQEEVRDLMRSASVLCLPCLRADDGNQDALPTVLLEAMACGLPVVSTQLSGIPEIIDDGVSGLLVEPSNPHGLAGALSCVLTSPELRQRLIRNGRRKVEQHFDLRANVSTLHAWHREIGPGVDREADILSPEMRPVYGRDN